MSNNDNLPYLDLALDYLKAAGDYAIDLSEYGDDTTEGRELRDRVNNVNTAAEAAGNLKKTAPVDPRTANAGTINSLNGAADGFDNGATLFEAFSGIGIGTEFGFQPIIDTLRGIAKKFRDGAKALYDYFNPPGDPDGDGLIIPDGKQPSNVPSRNFGNFFFNRDPLILDLDSGGVSLTSLGLSNAYFDLDGNGFAERTGWVSSGEGLLALDVNRNGRIDGGSELFGNSSENGFTVLARYDENGDGRITSADSVWDNLLVWRDVNGDATSTPAELTGVAVNEIGAINLNARTGRLGSRSGNPLLAVGNYIDANGFSAEAIAVAFTSDQSNTRFVLPDGFEYDPEVFLLPNLRGYGALPDLWVAMSLDPVLKAMVQNLVAGNYDDISDLVGDAYSIKHPDYYRYGFLKTGDTTYHYKASAFDDMVARWAGVPINDASSANNFDERQAELTAERILGRSILNDRGAGNPNFHNAFSRLSNELATRFVVAMADAAQNQFALDLFDTIIGLDDGGNQPIDPAVLSQLIDQALASGSNPPELSAFLQRYAALDYNFSTDTVTGDVTAFIDQELQAFEFDPANPWRGWTVWEASHTQILAVVDPDSAILDERRRAYTGNQMLDILRPLYSGFTNIVSGSGIVNSDSVLGTTPANGRRDLVTGSADDDMLMGGSGSDTYVFTDGGGSDTVVDSAGTLDEVAFQGTLSSTLAQASLEGSTGRDLRIRFSGRDETVLIKNYLDASGSATIEKITFPDGPTWAGRFVRDLAIASRVTAGNDRLKGTIADETISGGDGNDTLGFSAREAQNSSADNDEFGADVFIGGAGNDLLQGAYGNDVFQFSRGDGHDTVRDIGGRSSIEFDESISPDDIEIRAVQRAANDPRSVEHGVDIVLSVRDADQSITLYHALSDYHSSYNSNSFVIRFANGATLTSREIIARAIEGTDGNDELFATQSGSTLAGGEGDDRLSGYIGDDILIGGKGNDELTGSLGRDEYRISRGDGHDGITVSTTGFYTGSASSELDTIRFDNSIASDQVTFALGSDDKSIVISIDGEDQSIIVTDFFEAIDRIRVQFTDGTIRSGQQMFALATTPTAGADRFFGSRLDDALSGGDGDDRLLGNAGNDILSGDGGDDRLEGGFGDDNLIGGEGNDRLSGGQGVNDLTGGTGNDDLLGGFGLNRFHFALGDGHDTVTFGGPDDEIIIDAPSVTAQFQISAPNRDDLKLIFANGDQSITIANALTNNGIGNNLIRFSDGASFSVSQLLAIYSTPTEADDVIFGSHLGGLLAGNGGNDQLLGGNAADVLDGGAGDDTLAGGTGDNIFRFGIGSGNDQIIQSGYGNDTVEFGAGITTENLIVTGAPDGSFVRLTIEGHSDSLTIDRRSSLLASGTFRFSGGLVWDVNEIFQRGFAATTGDDVLFASEYGSVLQGLAGNDSLFGSYASDTLEGGEGNDFLAAGGGQLDIYRFSRGDGQDIIEDWQGSDDGYQTSNILEFGEGIAPDDLLVFRDRNGSDLIFRFKGSSDTIRLKDVYLYDEENGEVGGPYGGGIGGFVFREIRFQDGTVWSLDTEEEEEQQYRFAASASQNNSVSNIPGNLLPEIYARLSEGTVEGDIIYGAQGVDILDPLGFYDTIVGEGGDDVFVFQLGYGEMTIDQHNSGYFEPNNPNGPRGATLRLGEGISTDDLDVRSNAAGDLVIDLGDGDIINLLRARSEGPRPLPQGSFDFSGVMFVEFADGTTWRHDDLIAHMFTGRPNQTSIVGDLIGGTLDPAGFATEIYSISFNDQIRYEQGYGAVKLHVSLDSSNNNGQLLDAGLHFGAGLSIDTAQISFDEAGSLILDFGNGDRIEIVGALNSDSDAGIATTVESFFFADRNWYFQELVELSNQRLIESGSTEKLTLVGDGTGQYFDTQGIADVIDGGGGEDGLFYARGYGEITVKVAARSNEGAALQNEIFIAFDQDIFADDLVVRTGEGNEIVLDLGNGDVITLEFERDFNVDLLLRGDQRSAVWIYFFDETYLSGQDILDRIDLNDCPEIQTPDIAMGVTATEGSNLTLAGEFSFSDFDSGDRHTFEATQVIVSGEAGGLPSTDELLTLFTGQIVQEASGADDGNARWLFAADTSLFDYLSDGETVTLAYTAVIDDGRGGMVTRDISVTVTGTNQLPEIIGGVFGATVNPALSLGSVAGQISFVDVDLSQTHHITVLSAIAEGDITGLPSQADLLTWLDLGNPTPQNGTSGSPQNLSWTFDSANFDFSYLGLTDQLRLTYQVEIRDSSGGTAVQDIVIVFRQSVLAAGALSPIDGEVFAEDSIVDLAVPASLFADSIQGSLTIEATLANGAALPEWLSFDGQRLTGTPPANFNGQLDIRVTASNGTDAVHDFVGLSIEAVNDAPVVAAALQDYSFGAGNLINISVPAQAFADADGDTLTYSAKLADGSDLPSWLSLDDGIFTGTPPLGYEGVIGIIVIASDGISATEQSFNLAIGLANAAPSLAQPLYDWQIREDEAVDIVLRDHAFRDAENDALTMTAQLSDGTDLPSWLNFDGVRFTGMPPANFNGVLDIAVSASDGSASVTDIFRLTIDPVSDAPVVANTLTSIAINEDGFIDFTIPADVFVDADGDALALNATLGNGDPLPSWLSFADGRFTGTPPANFNGSISLMVIAYDGSASASSAFDLVINPVNDAPVAGDDSGFVTDEDVAITISTQSLIANDSDVEGDMITVSAVASAIGGTATLVGGQIEFTPDENFYGDASFTYSASDPGGASGEGLVSITVLPVNDAPIAMSEIADVVSEEDQAVSFALSSDAFTDVDGDPLTYTVILANGDPLPSWLTFDGQQFSGTPSLNFNGVITIAAIASDGVATAAQQFTLTITPQNDAPVVAEALADRSSPEDQAISIMLPQSAFADIDGNILTLSATLANGSTLPSWLTLTDGQFTGTPPADFNGFLDIEVMASDGSLSASDIFRLSVTPVNDAPVVTLALIDRSSAEDTGIDFTIPADSFTDVDSASLVLTAALASGAALPGWLAFDAASRRFTGAPPENFSGAITVRVTASDGTLSASDEFALTITPVNDAPVAANDSGLLAVAGTALVVQPATLLVNDNDVDGDALTILSVGAAVGGTVSLNAQGQVVYTANSGYQGTGSFSYTVSDGALTSTATASVQVTSNGGPWVYGTSGNDNLYGQANAVNRIDGLAGDDMITGGNLNDELVGGLGNDRIYAGAGNDSVTGGDGNDEMTGDAGDDVLVGGIGLDKLYGGLGNDTIDAGDGNDIATGDDGYDVITGGAGDDLLYAGAGNDGVDGGAGNDTITGDAGNDTLAGGIGNDFIYAGAGNDMASGGDGADGVYGDDGTDILSGGLGNDVIDGGAGIDTVDYNNAATAWTINLTSNSGSSGTETDTIYNMENVIGGAGNDVIIGNTAVNTLSGGDGNDNLNGGSGNDVLNGDAGDDIITGGTGNDTVSGGAGTDRLVLAGLQASYSITTVNGTVSIVDNQPNTDGNDGTDTILSIEQLQFKGGTTVGVTSPIILDLDGNGVKTISAADSNARYDLDSDGLADDTSWFGSGEGMLFLDRDGNGTVSNAGEFSFIDDVAGARSDLEGLRAFDSNRDGQLSSLDTKFAQFKVWQDRDSDGVAEAGEILSLTQASVRSIRLTGTAVNGTTQLGDVAVVNRGSYTRTNGTTMEFLDAALTYFSSATNLPTIAVQDQSLGRKADKYRITISGGTMTLAPKKGQIDPRAGGLGASSMLSFKNQTIGMLSPIILDLDGDGVEMASIKKSKASFDMNGDGVADDTGWAGKGDGFLVIDRNNDGKITHASELSFASEDKDARSDLEALAALDNNRDRVLNKDDARFGELKVWIDANGNGTTDAGELKTLAELGITEIGLTGRNIDGTAKVGDNVLISTATFTRENGSVGTLGNAALAYRPGTETRSRRGNGSFDDNSRVSPERVVSDIDNMPTGELGAVLAALRGSGRGPDIARILSDIPADIDAFDYYGPMLDKTVPIMDPDTPAKIAPLPATGMLHKSIPIMDVLTDKGGAVTTTDEPPIYKSAPVMDNPTGKTATDDDGDGIISKRAPVMDVLTGKGFAVTDTGGPLIAKIAPVMDILTDKNATRDSGHGTATAKRAPVMDTDRAKLAASDRLLAIIAQDMAAFGARNGENDLSWRRDGAKPVDYFA